MENSGTVLVTGGTGFVGMRIILQLLQQGYAVRTTVRQISSRDKITKVLGANGISVASPVFFDVPKDEQVAIRPAVEGILRVLKFAKATGVQRVVMTSNFGAVGFSQTDKTRKTTEADWTDVNLKGLSVYEKSKTQAEKAAWDFIEKQGGELEFATINAVAIYGPSINAHISGSFHLLTNPLNGSMKMVPNIPLNVVDVRDVADLHIRAMINPAAAGQRFIATADGQITLPEIAQLLKNRMPEVSGRVSLKKLPNFIVRIGALFNARAREGNVFLNMNRKVSNVKAKTLLGWNPIGTQEETILAAVESMVKYDLIK